MNSYMPQDMFDMIAVTAALYKESRGLTIEEVAKVFCDLYRNDYIDDGYDIDVVSAAHKVLDFMKTTFPGVNVATPLIQMQYCIKHFRPNGKKKGLLQGQLFNQQKTPLPNRIEQCLSDIMIFHIGSLSGTFPVAPEGWSM
jgi:hypothetical protein